MSSIHALQRSTTSEKLLKSVQALRPFLCESLRKNGFDPFEYTNGDDDEHDTYLQTPAHCGNVKDILIQGHENSGNILGSENHGMCTTYDQGQHHQVHTIYGDESNAQCHGRHGDHVDEGDDGGRTHQQYNHIGFTGAHNGSTVHDENIGYVHDDYYMNEYVSDQYIGYEHHEGNTPNRSSAHMLESGTFNSDLLSSLQPSARFHEGALSLANTQDDCKFPTEETLQPTLNLSSYTHLHSQHNYQEFQHYPQSQDIVDGMAASIYNIDLNAHDAKWLSWCNDNVITSSFCSDSTEAQVRKATCAKAASSQQRKRRRANLSRPDTNAKQKDSFDESDALEDDDGDNCSNPNAAAKASGFSNNLDCERRRRKKINEALYALRSAVPIVSKMDKASIMSDALTYAKQLRKRVDDLQNDILNLQVSKDAVDCTSIDEHVQEEPSGSSSNPDKSMHFEKYVQSLPKHKILELSVFNMDNNTYHLRICCKKGPGDLLHLARAIEALDFDILNSTVASVGDQSTINTVVVKVQDTDEVLKPEEVKEMMLEIVSKYGLHV